MARFRGTVRGDRGEASRLGHRNLDVSANGWNVGVRVESAPEDEDRFYIYATGGSSAGVSRRFLGTVSRGPDGLPIFDTTGAS